MQTAALALTLGYPDPLRLLGADVEDLEIMRAVLTEAVEIRARRSKSEADYQAAQTAALTTKGVVRGVARILARLVKG